MMATALRAILAVSFVGLHVLAQADCESNYTVRGQCVPPGMSPLEYYVRLPDDAFRFEPAPLQTLSLPNASAFVLNMTSQRWRSDAAFANDSPAGSLWRHQLIVVIPDAAVTAGERVPVGAVAVGGDGDNSSSLQERGNRDDAGGTSWIWVTGGENEAGGSFTPIAEDDAEVATAARLAVETGQVTAVLKQVPNQPVQFAFEIPHDPSMYPAGLRSEDGIIAYGWNQFIFNDTSPGGGDLDAEWLLRLPMAKAVSRAMDVMQTFAATRGVHPAAIPAKFVVGGASKRGWTTWAVGLVEPRVAAIVPVVMDLLNLRKGEDLHWRSLGGWTYEYNDYLQAGLVGPVIHSARYAAMCAVNDAFSYFEPGSPWPARHFDTIPKMVVNAGNDEFFLPDDNHEWWNLLPGEKHLLHIPNAEHGFHWYPWNTGNGSAVFVGALSAFFGNVVRRRPRPSFTWKFDTAADGLSSTVVVGNFSATPASVALWQATTSDGFRDFRLLTCRTALPGHNCTAPEADPFGNVTGGPRPHPVRYVRTVLQPQQSASPDSSESLEYRSTVHAPVDGNFTAFVVDIIFDSTVGSVSPGRATTQMQILPAALPFKPCESYAAGACERLI